MRFVSFAALVLLTVAVLTACNSAERRSPGSASAPSAPTPSDGVRRVTVAELKEMLANNEAVVIDVRNEASFNAGHIKGARLIPETEVKNRAAEMPKDKVIVTYCAWPNEHTSARAVVDLREKGVTNAGALLGGYVAWQNAGLPIDTKAATN